MSNEAYGWLAFGIAYIWLLTHTIEVITTPDKDEDNNDS